jgi:YesN/AraC family two-component response regulator
MVRILLVEDNHVFRESFKQSISNHFSEIIIDEADTGEEALEKVNRNPPHLIFMDLRLPGMNGLQATRNIKAAFPEVRVAMLTGYDVPEYRQAALQYGAERFFVKESVEWNEVEALIKSIRGWFCEA